MRKVLCLIVFSLIIMLAICSEIKAVEKTYVYHSITKDKVVTYTENVKTNETQIITATLLSNGEMMQTILNPDYTTRNWEFQNKEQDTNLKGVRNGNEKPFVVQILESLLLVSQIRRSFFEI